MSKMDANLFWGFLFLVFVAGFTAYYARQRGRDPFFWFVVGLLLGIFAPLVLFLFPIVKKEADESLSPSVPPAKADTEAHRSVDWVSAQQPDQDKLWYYLDRHHQQFGPVSLVALRALWNRGQLELGNYVWTEGMERWEKVEDLPELNAALNREAVPRE